MGAVYLARDQELDRLVALKVLPPDVGDSAERRARFRREAQLAAKLTHPNIVPLHSFGESDGLMYYAMGYVRGESLADRLRREGRIPQEEIRLQLAQLAEALEYAHGKGVIHRDIKPDNILLDDETGRPLLADFGIARATGRGGTLTEAGSVMGTVHYMSPEQAIGATSLDGRSDLYSLGVVGYVMVAGRTPFDAQTFSAFVAQQASADPPPLISRVPDISPDLATAVMRCLTRDATSRWPDARTFKQSLGAALEDDSERLPGELREIAGALFWTVVGGWIVANIMLLVLPARGHRWWTILPAALLLGIVYVVTAAVHVR
jgi:serine/threonine protein kinase